jgi:hypothetical protein
MFRKVLLTFLLAFWAVPLFAQSVDTAWVRRYNGPGNNFDVAQALAVDDSGNVYVTGVSDGYETFYDYATIKYHANGDTAWIRRYNGTGHGHSDVARAVAVDDHGNVYVTGYSDGHYLTIKYDEAGIVIWAESGPVGGSSAMVLDVSGNICIAGSDRTIKYDEDGNEFWVGMWGGVDITSDPAANVYVTGGSYRTVKYYPNGDTAWVRVYEGPPHVDRREVQAITTDSSGNVYVTGTLIVDLMPKRCATVKYNSSGDQLWAQVFNIIGCYDNFRDLATDGADNVYVTGHSCGEYITLRYDQAGNEIWARKYDGPENSTGGAFVMAVDSGGNVYVTGINGAVFATVKYDSLGSELWAARWGGLGNDWGAYAIAVDDPGNVYVTGASWDSAAYYDYTTIKYVQFLRADVDKRGEVNLADVVYLVNYLFKAAPGPVPAPIVGDATCDSSVDITDVIFLIEYLLRGGPAPCI